PRQLCLSRGSDGDRDPRTAEPLSPGTGAALRGTAEDRPSCPGRRRRPVQVSDRPGGRGLRLHFGRLTERSPYAAWATGWKLRGRPALAIAPYSVTSGS